MRWMVWVVAATVSFGARGQWEIQESHTTASLRGIHALGNGVAWASGTGGTVLRTVDGGKQWQVCAVPPGAETLDFRGLQGFDAQTAIVMSSGKGDLSRLYKTVDGCATWKLVFTNPDKEGFFDSVSAEDESNAAILGDSVDGEARVWDWRESDDPMLLYGTKGKVDKAEGSFAASNSVLVRGVGPQIDKTWRYDLFIASG